MIYSMTGYAGAAREFPYGALSLELRSVNHRYLDIQFRLPDDLRSVEPSLRETLVARLTRGKVECRIAFAAAPAAGKAPELNNTLLQQLIALATRVKTALPDTTALGAADVLRWPGMLAADALPVEELKNACQDLLIAVLNDFTATRGREGGKLKALLLERAAAAEQLVAEVAPRMPQIVAAFREKLEQRLREAMASADDERIRQEIVLFANKVDVDEELTRLSTHFGELKRILAKGGTVGKRLDFLMQELNREANTLGSKAVDVAVTRVAMDLKLLIEQMREQIQNIE